MTTSSALLNSCIDAAAGALLPPKRYKLSEWADEHRRLSSEGSAKPGHWRTLPFQREPLDCISPDSPYEIVVLMCASQMGKSELILNLIAHVVAEDPAPILCVQPTLTMAEAFSKDRLAPMFRDMPRLQGLVANPKSRDAGSTIFHRRFQGGHVTIVGSNSPAGLASRPIRFLVADELDRFEASAGSEGDPVSLAMARTRSFWNRKILLTSSPTIKGASRIEAAYLEGDQRVFEVPCPHCGFFQALNWRRVEWPEGKPAEAVYHCAGCEQPIPHHRKDAMVSEGRWRAQNPGSTIASFWLSELYSPWRAWGQLADDFLKASGNPERLRTFINTSLAEPWNDEAETINEADLLARREAIGPDLPAAAAAVTSGVDVQDDRLEATVYAWGRGEESWWMAHRVFPGDPSGPTVWRELDAFLLQPWQHPIVGPMPIHATCIDSGGHFTNAVCAFAEERRGRRVFAIKGAAGARRIWPPKQSKAARGRVYVIGVDAARQICSQRLKLTEGPGCVHLPLWATPKLIEQLTSEFPQTIYKRGRPERTWTRKPGRAAEAWDCAVYAYAALCALQAHGMNLEAEVERIAARERAAVPSAAPVASGGYQTSRSSFVFR